jgi:gluconokinase
VIRERMEARQGHFFKPEMLAGQLSALEKPEADEDFFEADIRHSPNELARDVVRELANASTVQT